MLKNFLWTLSLVGFSLIGNGGLMNNANAADAAFPGDGKCYAQYGKADKCLDCQGDIHQGMPYTCAKWGDFVPQKWTSFPDVKVNADACLGAAKANVPEGVGCTNAYVFTKICFCTSDEVKDCYEDAEKKVPCNPHVNP